jgi:hypothetical protein
MFLLVAITFLIAFSSNLNTSIFNDRPLLINDLNLEGQIIEIFIFGVTGYNFVINEWIYFILRHNIL